LKNIALSLEDAKKLRLVVTIDNMFGKLQRAHQTVDKLRLAKQNQNYKVVHDVARDNGQLFKQRAFCWF
jgi:exonuclease I